MLCVEGCTVLSLGEERGGERARGELQGGHSRSLRKRQKNYLLQHLIVTSHHLGQYTCYDWHDVTVAL